MCGIAAILRRDGTRADVADLARMASAMRHRGPDGAAYAVLDQGRLGLAQLRLAVVDLVTGDQPMASADGEAWITFNGEIYDHASLRRDLGARGHVFHSTSDTEVLLALYREHGLAMFPHLNGEFAFVLWDSRNRRLVAARDRSGVKPLFYRATGDEILFASEQKGITALPRVERRIAKRYLTGPLWGVFPDDTCLLEGLTALRPGHYLVVEDGVVSAERRYWERPWQPVEGLGLDAAAALVRTEVTRAVRRRRVADVPVCTYLSGGVDSAIITSLLAAEGPIQAFHVSFIHSVYDEQDEARDIARHCGAAFEALPVTMEDLAAGLADTLYHTETHLTNPSAVGKFLLSSLVRRRGFKVTLTGEGADEVFAGYPYFKLETLWRMEERGGAAADLARRLWPAFKQIEARSEGTLWNRHNRWRTAERIFGFPCFTQLRTEQYASLLSHLFEVTRLGIDPRYEGPARTLRQALDTERLRGLHPLHASLDLAADQLAAYIIPTLGDRVEMAHSVEGRTPFLDRDVLACGGRIPPDLHLDIGGLWEKAVLRKAFADLLPERHRGQHKHPFFAPSWKTLAATPTGRALSEAFLTRRALAQRGMFAPRFVRLLESVRSFAPRSGALHRRLDVVLGSVLSLQILHHRLVERAPACDPMFPMVRCEAGPGMMSS